MTDLHTAAMKLALEAAYLAGFNASGEGYNAEYPFGDHNQNPEEDAVWVKDRDNYVSQALREALAEQPAQQEPFGYFRYDLRLDAWVQNRAGLTGTPFYTHPQTREPLTDEQVAYILGQLPKPPTNDGSALHDWAMQAVHELAAHNVKE